MTGNTEMRCVPAVLLGAVMAMASAARAQTPATVASPSPAPPRSGGFVPGQKRPPGDPAQIERGKTLYSINCQGCHGSDLRGGDMGGPSLLRSQVALSDQNGELILPIIQGSRRAMGMPAIDIGPADGLAVAAYIRSVVETIGRQGTPPSVGLAAPSVLVGNASEGQAYFATKCSGCHSASGDMQGIATRIPDPKLLQNTWVAGGGRMRRGWIASREPDKRTPTVTVLEPSGQKIEGTLVRIDDFLVTVNLPGGTVRTITRNGHQPKVEVHDPMKPHRELLAELTDKDMHDVTAYLVTLK